LKSTKINIIYRDGSTNIINLIIIFKNTFYLCFIVSKNNENIGTGNPTQSLGGDLGRVSNVY